MKNLDLLSRLVETIEMEILTTEESALIGGSADSINGADNCPCNNNNCQCQGNNCPCYGDNCQCQANNCPCRGNDCQCNVNRNCQVEPPKPATGF